MTDKKKKPGPKPRDEVELVMVQCICSNVHLGNGVVLHAFRDSPSDNWDKGETAEVSKGLADIMVEKKQVKII